MRFGFLIFFACILLPLGTVQAAAQTSALPYGQLITISPEPGKGFHWAYYLYLPKSLAESAAQREKQYLLVAPNNTGSPDDNIQAHEEAARRKMIGLGSLAESLQTPLLQPVFPRPKQDWKLYTHALDRDTLLTETVSLKRLDLQLIAMIGDAARRLKANKISLDRKVLMYGFSASGMFTNRFALLHPERIFAAAIGSPGGWPMAPVEKYRNQMLRYPLGVGDLRDILNKGAFHTRAFKALRLYFFLGDKDTNDSLTYRDGYEKEDEELVVKHFGRNLVERWKSSEKLYQESGCRNCRFVLYKDTDHKVSNQMITDVIAFFRQAIDQQR